MTKDIKKNLYKAVELTEIRNDFLEEKGINELLKIPDFGFDILNLQEYVIIYSKLTPPATYGNRISSYIAHRMGWKNVSINLHRGDYVDSNNKYYESKCSILDSNMNFVQIRPLEEIDGTYFFAFDKNKNYESLTFFLTKEQIIQEIEEIGQIAHGYKKYNDDGSCNLSAEWALRPNWIPKRNGSKITKDYWLENYLVPNFLNNLS